MRKRSTPTFTETAEHIPRNTPILHQKYQSTNQKHHTTGIRNASKTNHHTARNQQAQAMHIQQGREQWRHACYRNREGDRRAAARTVGRAESRTVGRKYAYRNGECVGGTWRDLQYHRKQNYIHPEQKHIDIREHFNIDTPHWNKDTPHWNDWRTWRKQPKRVQVENDLTAPDSYATVVKRRLRQDACKEYLQEVEGKGESQWRGKKSIVINNSKLGLDRRYDPKRSRSFQKIDSKN